MQRKRASNAPGAAIRHPHGCDADPPLPPARRRARGRAVRRRARRLRQRGHRHGRQTARDGRGARSASEAPREGAGPAARERRRRRHDRRARARAISSGVWRSSRAIRSSSTSGRRGAGRAARSSRCSPTPSSSTATRSPSSASTSPTRATTPLKFIKESPPGFASVSDPKGEAARSLGGGRVAPTTFFIGRDGKRVVHEVRRLRRREGARGRHPALRARHLTRPGGLDLAARP